jgi:hypothetical protein
MASGPTESALAPPLRTRSKAAGARVVRCGGCTRSYELAAWLALPVQGMLAGEAIAAHVVKWPPGVCIEVRRCARCGGAIARMVEPEGP